MKEQVAHLLPAGSKCKYIYDLGSSTYLEIQTIAEVCDCSQGKIKLLMRNQAPAFHCESCQNTSDLICSFCGETLCSSCVNKHSCVIDEGEAYMILPLVNSPRAGVCGYDGS